jgi:hypothetical protein
LAAVTLALMLSICVCCVPALATQATAAASIAALAAVILALSWLIYTLAAATLFVFSSIYEP